MSILFIVLLVCIAIIMIIKLIDALTGKLGPTIATPLTAMGQINTALGIKSSSEVWEIGCGDARVLSYCAKLHPNANFIGIDNGILMLIRAKWRTRNQDNVEIKRANLKSANLSGATNIYIYLIPEALVILKNKIPRNCKVVSLEFKLPNKKPSKTIQLNNPSKFAHRLYCYQF